MPVMRAREVAMAAALYVTKTVIKLSGSGNVGVCASTWIQSVQSSSRSRRQYTVTYSFKVCYLFALSV